VDVCRNYRGGSTRRFLRKCIDFAEPNSPELVKPQQHANGASCFRKKVIEQTDIKPSTRG
jgi:hypothetical protein